MTLLLYAVMSLLGIVTMGSIFTTGEIHSLICVVWVAWAWAALSTLFYRLSTPRPVEVIDIPVEIEQPEVWTYTFSFPVNEEDWQ